MWVVAGGSPNVLRNPGSAGAFMLFSFFSVGWGVYRFTIYLVYNVGDKLARKKQKITTIFL
jgi:hypothetical protein